jgi:pimeloyl-ACP methyl ester carboxylesterase
MNPTPARLTTSTTRRRFLGVALGASLMSPLIPTVVSAGHEDDRPRIVANEYFAPGISAKDDRSPIKLFLFEKFDRALDPNKQAASGRIVLVLHGATTSGRVNNDVQVPDVDLEDSFSLLDQLAQRGYDAWTLDYQHYGRSDHHDCGLCVVTDHAARDIASAVKFILGVRGAKRLHLIGWSWGGSTGGLFAQRHSEQVNRLVLYAPVLDLQKDFSKSSTTPPTFDTSPVFPVPTAHFRDNTPNNAAALKGFFHPTARVPEVVEAYVQAALKVDSMSPNGVLKDWRTDPLKMDPAKLRMPTLVIGGADDDRAALVGPLAGPNARSFMQRLGATEKKLVIVANAGHGLFLEEERDQWYAAVLAHLGAGNRPPDDDD